MRREACCCAPLGGQTEHQSDSAQVALSKSRSKSPRQFDLASCTHRRDLCRLTLVRRQKAADGDANQKHRGKHHSNCAFVSWRRKPSHLLVQKFLIENEPGRRSAAKPLSKDEARRIAANIAKLPDRKATRIRA